MLIIRSQQPNKNGPLIGKDTSQKEYRKRLLNTWDVQHHYLSVKSKSNQNENLSDTKWNSKNFENIQTNIKYGQGCDVMRTVMLC